MLEHEAPCGDVQRLDERVKGVEGDVQRHETLLDKVQNRLPTWAVLYQNSLSAACGFLIGLVYFLIKLR